MAPAMNRGHLRRSLIILVVMAWLALMLLACSDSGMEPRRQWVNIDGQTFNLELALYEKAWEQGLSDREEIEANGGMLFVFHAARPRTFVMRRCYVPIDLIFLDANGFVVKMHQMHIEPNPYAPDSQLTPYDSIDPAQFAIELRGGTLGRLKVHIADRINLPVDSLKRLARTARSSGRF